MLAGCASSRTFQLKQERVADNSRSRIKHIKLQKAAEIAKDVLKENKYSCTYFEYKPDHYARMKAKKYIGIFYVGGHRYRTEIKITKKDHGHEYKVSSNRKYVPFLEFFPPFRLYHRDEKEEKKILDAIEQKYHQ